MRVNGFKIKQEIELIELSKLALESELKNSYLIGDGEEKRSPKDIIAEIEAVETKIVEWQSIRAWYNQVIMVEYEGKSTRLATIIKMDGVLGRTVKLWKECVSAADQAGTYGKEEKKPAMSTKACYEAIREATIRAAKIQSIIGVENGNHIEVEIPQ